MSDTELFFMDEAIKLAEHGMRSGDGGPFGAVIVREGKIIGSGWNKVLKTNDPTAHAEIVAIRAACLHTGDYWLKGCRIYSTCEPCPMCLAAIYWARIESLTFAATRSDAAALDFDDAFIYKEVSRPTMERSIETHECLREKALQIMQLWPTMDSSRPY